MQDSSNEDGLIIDLKSISDGESDSDITSLKKKLSSKSPSKKSRSKVGRKKTKILDEISEVDEEGKINF